MKWIVVVLVASLYVQLFIQVARLYFDSERTLTLTDLWGRFFPTVQITLT
jgi:hypothetical protein